MFLDRHYPSSRQVESQLQNSTAMSSALFRDVVASACRRLPALAHTKDAALLTRFEQIGAWTDAALLLVKLEKPHWQLRRLIMDDGEWLCSLSKQSFLPSALDDMVEASHENAALAVFLAFLQLPETAATLPEQKTSAHPAALSEGIPLCCEDFS